MGRGGRKVEIKPPEGFDRVYLPDRRFERIAEALADLGFKVDAYMCVPEDEDKVDSRILDTCLDASKKYYLGDVYGIIRVEARMSTRLYSIAILYTSIRLDEILSIPVKALTNPSPARFIAEVKEVEWNISRIIEEDIKKRGEKILKRRENRRRFESIMEELGFKKGGLYYNYVKSVNGYTIDVFNHEETGKCTIYLGLISYPILADVIKSIEDMLAKLPKPSESRVEGSG